MNRCGLLGERLFREREATDHQDDEERITQRVARCAATHQRRSQPNDRRPWADAKQPPSDAKERGTPV